tara:strand:- start:151 stop:381 length:231 start_codon:yes stop_codon:yes gene_type:complete
MCRASDRVNKPILFLPCAQFEDQLPITVGNFVDLAKTGYYEGLTFHRVIPNFMNQVCHRVRVRVRARHPQLHEPGK